MILLKVAFRNLREHKIKTLIIGMLITLGITFLVIGNSVMASITKGMKDSYSNNFTGDLIIRNVSDEDVSFIGGFGATPPALKNYTDITSYLDTLEDVEAYTPLLTGSASINKDDETLSFALLWGIEPSSYREMFADSFILTAGEDLQDGEEGIVLSKEIVDEVSTESGVALEPGTKILLSGQNNTTGTKIREVTIRGIGYFENSAGLLDRISFVDTNTLRALTGLTAVRIAGGENPQADAPLDEDALFGGTLVTEAPEPSDAKGAALDFENILGDTSVREKYLALDNNAWYYLLIKLADGASPTKVGNRLANNAAATGEEFLVENWRWGAGFIADLAFGIRNILNIVILVISIVAVIIIMNTLVISVTERIAEIGTVRAIGGQRSFVRGMITIEVLMITLVFGIIGMALGSAIIGIFNVVGIGASNLFLRILFGGSVLKPILSISSLFGSLIIVAVIGVVASLYPASVALGITPVQAMQRR